MPLFRRSSPAAPAEPWPWWRRHKVTCGVVVAVLVAGALVAWRPWQDCGPGLTSAVESPEICVGLNLESGPFRDGDQLEDLEKKVADHNAAVRREADRTGSDFNTVVLVNDMTPGLARDSASLQNVRHGIQGALTAAARKHKPVVLLLANYGPRGSSYQQVRDEILRVQESQHIVAVTGLGQSLEQTRNLANDLSQSGLAVVGSLVSGDDMNKVPGSDHHIGNFFRITPTNTDAARAAVSYLQKNGDKFKNVLRVQDENPGDGYAQTLGAAFGRKYEEQFGPDKESVVNFNSPQETMNELDRHEHMRDVFADKKYEICDNDPDLIYFAGRGYDMASFLEALTDGGCPKLSPVTVLTSDDATSIINEQPESREEPLQVLYTGAGTKGQWEFAEPPQPENAKSYRAFESEFFAQRFEGSADLVDGYAMSNYDAVSLAAEAARTIGSVPYKNTTLVADAIKNRFDCRSPFYGATGEIAFRSDSHGNPINKAMPVMQIDPDGKARQQDLVWSDGVPFGDDNCH